MIHDDRNGFDPGGGKLFESSVFLPRVRRIPEFRVNWKASRRSISKAFRLRNGLFGDNFAQVPAAGLKAE